VTITRKDLTATILTALVVLTYAATHEGWGVPLVGGSRRWATGAILVLGMLACSQGSKVERTTMTLYALLGGLALVFAVLAFWTGSLTPLSLLVVDIVLLWAASTLRHAWHPPGRTIPT
jgi:hypothetical protein